MSTEVLLNRTVTRCVEVMAAYRDAGGLSGSRPAMIGQIHEVGSLVRADEVGPVLLRVQREMSARFTEPEARWLLGECASALRRATGRSPGAARPRAWLRAWGVVEPRASIRPPGRRQEPSGEGRGIGTPAGLMTGWN